QRNAYQVVDEGPEQILADLVPGAPADFQGGGYQARVAAHQGDAGGLHGHVGAAAHGDADIRGGQRRRIVDTVPDHGYGVSVAFECGDMRGLVGWQYLGMYPVDAEQTADVAGTAGVVTADQMALDVACVQAGDGLGGALLEAVTEGQQAEDAGRFAVFDEPGQGAPLSFPGLCLNLQLAVQAQFVEQALVAKGQVATLGGAAN